MISFLVDQNFNEHIVGGLIRRDSALELTHVRDVGLDAAPHPTVLDWAAGRGLVVLTHDSQDDARVRIRPGQRRVAYSRSVRRQ